MHSVRYIYICVCISELLWYKSNEHIYSSGQHRLPNATTGVTKTPTSWRRAFDKGIFCITKNLAKQTTAKT